MSDSPQAFTYDDFEQYLLDTAQLDDAPADLSVRIGAALGVGLPVLAAAEMSSLLPTTTSLTGATGLTGSGLAGSGLAGSGLTGSGLMGATAAHSGFVAGMKSVLGATASTLFGTAAKGALVGLLSGVAVIGSVRTVSMITAPKDEALAVATTNRFAKARVETLAALPGAHRDSDSSEHAALGDEPGDSESEMADLGEPTPTTRKEVGVFSGYDPVTGSATTEPDDKRPRVRLPRPIFPEKTTAIARYPLLYDDVSALYDTPKEVKKAPAPVAKPAVVQPMIDPAELAAMRNKTIHRCRALLGQSKAAAALTELNDFRHHVGDGNFGVDELLLHIEALAVLGRAKEAQADVAIVERLAPNSSALRQAQALARSRFVR